MFSTSKEYSLGLYAVAHTLTYLSWKYFCLSFLGFFLPDGSQFIYIYGDLSISIYIYIYLCLYLHLYLYISRYISIHIFTYVCNIRIDTSHMVLQHLYLWTTRQTACSCFSIDLLQQSFCEKNPAL